MSTQPTLIPCAHCGKPATCIGVYEDPSAEPAYACDTCCAHGCEDGHCDDIEQTERVRGNRMTTNDTKPTLPLGWHWTDPTRTPELRDPEGKVRAAITGAAWYVHADDRHGAARGTAVPAEGEADTVAAKREAEAELRRRGAFGPDPAADSAELAGLLPGLAEDIDRIGPERNGQWLFSAREAHKRVARACELLLAERADVTARPLAALRAAGFEVAPASLSVSIPHVWDVDGQPRGIRHSLTLSADGATLTARDECLDLRGEPIGPSLDEASMPFVDAVHILVNLTLEERQRYGSERTTQPETVPSWLLSELEKVQAELHHEDEDRDPRYLPEALEDLFREMERRGVALKEKSE